VSEVKLIRASTEYEKLIYVITIIL